ncbi:type II restriction endonuclease [Candidatus Methanomassiliicoccus intestinalis]|uniref:type II restriction endonuclease n=1 Tax=Candidatus Methanomassiliicoccus intestinalis TaxID=1406512 RepID=UPI0037DDCD1F
MKEGYLSQYFTGVALKSLSRVEIDVAASHQHEFNGVSKLKKLFGNNSSIKISIPTVFLYLSDSDSDHIEDRGTMTWYDARRDDPSRSEFRLYFPENAAMRCASENDDLLIARKVDGSVIAIVAEYGSTVGNQIKWLFGVDNSLHSSFSVRGELETEQDRLTYVSRVILDIVGVEVLEENETFLDEMQRMFPHGFPKTKEFSEYARSTVDMDPASSDPDDILMMWIEREDILFRTLEKHIETDKLISIAESRSLDSFIEYSKEVLNRRKSRAGFALENHVEALLKAHGIMYTRGGITEDRNKPDFIFPDIMLYQDPNFDEMLLTMLGVKTTCKDRWRQILSEAERITEKHLLTLQAAISENQIEQMKQNKVRLVVPRGIQVSYPEIEKKWLMSVSEFLDLVSKRQQDAGVLFGNGNRICTGTSD